MFYSTTNLTHFIYSYMALDTKWTALTDEILYRHYPTDRILYTMALSYIQDSAFVNKSCSSTWNENVAEAGFSFIIFVFGSLL